METKESKKDPWDIVCFSDSDYAGDPVTRRSISGFVLYVLGVHVPWQLKAQRTMSLSSSDAAIEVMFVIRLLQSMNTSFKNPVVVRVDNVEATFIVRNVTTTSHIKHLDIRYKYVNKHMENGKVNIVFVKSDENESNILTKNLNEDLFEIHLNEMIGEKPECYPRIFKNMEIKGF